jgi:hypothetical protein
MTRHGLLTILVMCATPVLAQSTRQSSVGNCSPNIGEAHDETQIEICSPKTIIVNHNSKNVINYDYRHIYSGPRDATEIAFWHSVEKSNTKQEYEAYLHTFPRGYFAGLARKRAAHIDEQGFVLDDSGQRFCSRVHEAWELGLQEKPAASRPPLFSCQRADGRSVFMF